MCHSHFATERKGPLRFSVKKDTGKTVVYQGMGPEWRPFGNPKAIRPYDSVILHQNTSERIRNDVMEFLSSSKWYHDRGIPYRRGYLLYGPPGSGKTSYVMALAGLLQYNICVLNLADPGMSDDRLQHLLSIVPPQCIILLEDIDWAVSANAAKDGEAPEANPYAGLTRVTFSGLLNALDGVVATEERIVFMTTNNHERLPPVLIRPGRVDLKVWVGMASADQIRRMFVRFYPEASNDMADQFIEKVKFVPVSMAELQGFFLFFKDQPDQCIEAAETFAADIGSTRGYYEDAPHLQKETTEVEPEEEPQEGQPKKKVMNGVM